MAVARRGPGGDGHVGRRPRGLDRGECAGAGLEVTEDFIEYPRTLAGVRVAVVFKEVSPAEVKVSLRSRGTLDVRRVAVALGGGGHRNAAGCTLRMDLFRAKAVLQETLARLLPS